MTQIRLANRLEVLAPMKPKAGPMNAQISPLLTDNQQPRSLPYPLSSAATETPTTTRGSSQPKTEIVYSSWKKTNRFAVASRRKHGMGKYEDYKHFL